MGYQSSMLKLAKTIALMLTLMLAGFVQADGIKVGDMAPDFNIVTTEGKVFKLKHWRGKKPVYLVFWNTWCPYCIKKMPEYQEVYTFHGDELEFIAINTGKEDPIENLEPFAERHQLDLPLAYDFGQKISKAYGVVGTPTAFIIDINGQIRFRNGIPQDVSELVGDLPGSNR